MHIHKSFSEFKYLCMSETLQLLYKTHLIKYLKSKNPSFLPPAEKINLFSIPAHTSLFEVMD